jgi:uncharacterized Zn finger protein
MLTHTSKWSHARGNEVVPSRWQAIAVTDGSEGWQVEGSDGNRYTVTRKLHCDCAWGIEHDDNRGPCKHILAAILTLRDSGLD